MSSPPRRGRRGGGRRPSQGKKKSGPAPADLQPILDPPDVQSFEHFSLAEDILQGIRNMDIEVPTPIQALSVQPILDGRDLIAKAETGTGKTLAFGAPVMSKVDSGRSTVLALILCPTRELAQQVAGVMSALGMPRGVKTALVVGGDPIHPQVAELQKGAQVVVGTPGRVLDLYQQRFLSFPWTEFAVLDEADKMFEIGFLDDIRKILSLLPEERQTLLFSATYPREVLGLARDFTKDPVEVATAKGLATVESITQGFIAFRDEGDRALALIRMVEQSAEDDIFLVFLDRRTDVDRLLRRLERENFPVKALHGGYDQASRFRVMSAFRAAEVKVLLATDVAARGLDVEHVTHVINYAVPREVETYTHRIGRTGRAGREGHALTFVQPEDRRRWQAILREATWPIDEVEEPGRAPRRPRRDDRGGRDSDAERAERPRRPRRSDDGERNDRERDERPRRRLDRERAAEEPRGERGRGGSRRSRSEEEDGERRPRRSRDDERDRGRREESSEPRRRRSASTNSDREGRSRDRSRPEREPRREDRERTREDRGRESRREPRAATEDAAGGGWKPGQRGARPDGWGSSGRRERSARGERSSEGAPSRGRRDAESGAGSASRSEDEDRPRRRSRRGGRGRRPDRAAD